LTNVPAGLADGDDDTTYSAGAGLVLSGTEFSLVFGGDGATEAASRSDHTHFGQGWTGAEPLGLNITTTSTSTVSWALSGRAAQGIGILGLSGGVTELAIGVSGATSSPVGSGVSGVHASPSGEGAGVYGLSDSTEGIGVRGFASAATGQTTGVLGSSSSISGTGVAGLALAETGTAVSGIASSTSGENIGVFGATNSPEGLAGFFDGNVFVDGLIIAPLKPFRIDHPLDPENKYLSHNAIESSEIMNLYSGNVTLNEDGEAWVELPDWFEALNTDFRYQLTPIGAPGPNLYIAEAIQDNRFQIAGGDAGMVVSWQVTGVRHDAYAREHPLLVEQDKPAHARGASLGEDDLDQPVAIPQAQTEGD
jgi:hypothetical protein